MLVVTKINFFFSILIYQSKQKKNRKDKNLVCKNYIPLGEYITGLLNDVINKKSKRKIIKKVSDGKVVTVVM